MIVTFACTKDKGLMPDPVINGTDTTKPRINFVFVNRIGFRNDSTHHGINDTVFVGISVDAKYYSKSKNMTYLTYRGYNRNESSDPLSQLSDSVIFKEGKYAIQNGDKFGFKIGLKWINTIFPYTTRYLEYTTKNFSNGGDTIKISRDTIIKFIWPDDYNSSKFIKTQEYP